MKARGLPVPEMYEPPVIEAKPPATAAVSSQGTILLNREVFCCVECVTTWIFLS